MNVGVYFHLRNPQQWHRDTAHEYGFALELCEEAERLGAHSIWLSEHHGFADGYLPQPLTFAAGIAARTKRVRIGTAVLLASLRSAPQIAEEAAIVDLISGGRLELGLGVGYSRPEFELFGAEFDTRHEAMYERAVAVRQLWRDERVTPRPSQDPLPIWIGSTGPRSARRTGLLGEGLLRADPAIIGSYLDGLAEGGHSRASARIAGPLNVFLTDDPERDWPELSQHLAYQWTVTRHAITAGTDAPAPEIDPKEWRDRGLGGGQRGMLRGFVVDTPDRAARQIRDYFGDAPIETIFLWVGPPGVRQELAVRNVELACTELAPLLADVGVTVSTP